MDIDHIRTMIENGDYEVTQHAIDRMHQRGVTLDQVLNVFKLGRIHSERVKEKPLPKCLVAGYVEVKLEIS